MIDRKSNEIRGWIHVLESLERWGYLTAGLSFLLLGMLSFAYGWYNFLIFSLRGPSCCTGVNQ